MTTAYTIGRRTARDILVSAAGEGHALHSVKACAIGRLTIEMDCTCGARVVTRYTTEAKDALRNVPGAAS